MKDERKLFCSKPFSWFEVSSGTGLADGDTFVCCPTWLSKPIGNVSRSSVEEVWNSPTAADIRRSILDGSFEYCSKTLCPFLVRPHGPVQAAADVVDPLLRRAIDENLTVLPWGPLEVIASFDRSCNLSCPSCRTEVIMAHDRREQIETIQTKLENGALKDATYLHITGSGDPFGSPFFRTWLQKMKRANMPKLERIHLHTNALLWTKRVWKTIAGEIRGLIRSAEISIDAATPATYAVNRRGGQFERLLDNLEFISSELRANGPLDWVGFSMVVQQNNFAEMPEFVRLGKRFKADTVYFSQLVNWGTFTDEEYRSRAVHLPAHVGHPQFLEVLQDPIFSDPMVNLGNLLPFRNAAPAQRVSAGGT